MYLCYTISIYVFFLNLKHIYIYINIKQLDEIKKKFFVSFNPQRTSEDLK